MKRRNLESVAKSIGASHLADLQPMPVQGYLSGKLDTGVAAATVNHIRKHLVAFINWCVRNRRLPENPLRIIPKVDERKDRRRVRRALTNEELAKLLEVAETHDKLYGNRFASRRMVYLTAALTGLRRNEMRQITWADVDIENATVRVRVGIGKSSREDFIPLHDQLLTALLGYLNGNENPSDRVFKTMPTPETVRKDLKRAGIPVHDDEGRVFDLHALRTTLGTNLARHGIAPQLAQRIMRHTDYRTTLKHYTVLGLTDTARAVNSTAQDRERARAVLRAIAGNWHNPRPSWSRR